MTRPGCYGGLFCTLRGLCSGIAEDSVLRYAPASVGSWIPTLQGNTVPSSSTVERFQRNENEGPFCI